MAQKNNYSINKNNPICNDRPSYLETMAPAHLNSWPCLKTFLNEFFVD